MIQYLCSLMPDMSGSNSFYLLVKDFQTLIAALIALSAAAITYHSAQKVAQKQRDTTLEVAEAQRTSAFVERELQRLNNAIATLLALSVDIGKVDSAINYSKILCDHALLLHDDELADKIRSLFISLRRFDEWKEELLLLRFDLHIAGSLSPEEQYDIYLIATSTKGLVAAAKAFVEMNKESEAAGIKNLLGVRALIQSMDDTSMCIKDTAPAIRKTGKRLKEDYEALRAKQAAQA